MHQSRCQSGTSALSAITAEMKVSAVEQVIYKVTNNKIWHVLGEATEVHGAGNTWDLQRQQFWEQLAKMMTGGV